MTEMENRLVSAAEWRQVAEAMKRGTRDPWDETELSCVLTGCGHTSGPMSQNCSGQNTHTRAHTHAFHTQMSEIW